MSKQIQFLMPPPPTHRSPLPVPHAIGVNQLEGEATYNYIYDNVVRETSHIDRTMYPLCPQIQLFMGLT